MKRIYSALLFLFFSFLAFSNTPSDSLVRFSELTFHSEFEKQAFIHREQGNDLNLCLASDKYMTEEKAAGLRSSFNEMVKQLSQEKITGKNIRQKFAILHKIIFQKPSMQYVDNAEFSDILVNGYFNYLTSSVLYSLALKELNISSYFLFTLNKTDIIVNPDADQVILETWNRKDENGFFNTNNSKGYLVNLMDKNIRIGSEYQYNSSDGNVGVSFKASDVLKSNQLAATIYFYKAIQQLNAQHPEEAYRLIRKACYLFPQEPFITSMYTMLSTRLERCSYNKLEDFDLLGQLARFKSDNFDYIKNTFLSVMANKIIKENDLSFCTAAYNRLLPQITDVLLANEISYSYYIANANCNSIDMIKKLRPALQAFKLKPNDKQALGTIEFQLDNMADITEDRKSLLDTLDYYEKEMIDTEVAGMIKKTKWREYLILTRSYFRSNQSKEGTYYLNLFESSCKYPVTDRSFRVQIEDAYYESANFYVRSSNRAMAQKIVNKGLLYIPNSNMIQSATYVMPTQKPKITKRTMTKAQYDAYMKKNGPDR